MAKDAFIENTIEWLRDDDRATLSLSQRRVISKIEKYAKQYPDECEITARNNDGSICAHVPVSWIKISPKKKKQLTDEQRTAIGQRLVGQKRNKLNNNLG